MQGSPETKLLLAEVGAETSSNIDQADMTEYQFLLKGICDVFLLVFFCQFHDNSH